MATATGTPAPLTNTPLPTATPVPPTPTSVSPTTTPELAPAPVPIAPPDGSSGDGATLEWQWVRALGPGEDFIVMIVGGARPLYATTRATLYTVPGDVFSDGRTISWTVYVDRTSPETRISATSVTWRVTRRTIPGGGGGGPSGSGARGV